MLSNLNLLQVELKKAAPLIHAHVPGVSSVSPDAHDPLPGRGMIGYGKFLMPTFNPGGLRASPDVRRLLWQPTETA